MRKLVTAIIILAMFICRGSAIAADTDITANAIPDRVAQEGNISVATDSYAMEVKKYGRNWALDGYDQNAEPISLFNSLKENTMKVWYDAETLGRIISEGQTYMVYDVNAVKKIADVMFEALDNLSGPINYQWQSGVKLTPVVNELQDGLNSVNAKVETLAKRVDTNSNFINSMWLEEHGFNSITVKVKIDKLAQKVEIFDLNNNNIEAYFIIKDGDMGCLQTRRVAKLTTIAWNSRHGEFGVLHCADIYAGTPITSTKLLEIREVELMVTHKFLTETGVKTILHSKAFNLTNGEISEMLGK